jgi:hypothetical protein
MAKKKQEVVAEVETEVEVKPKRIITQEQREHLDRIRILANDKKRAMKEQAHKAKNLKNQEIEFKAKQYDDFQKKNEEVVKQPVKQPVKKKIVKKIIEYVEDDEEESEEEEEEVIKVVKRKPKETISNLAYQTSQEKLMNKVLEHRMSNAVNSMSHALAMQYY